MSETNIEAVEKVLGKPISGDLPENALKVRRNLLAFGLISIFIAFSGVKIDPSSSVLGFKFIGITDTLIRNCLLLTDIYLIIHFLWYASEGFMEWRIRVTGTRLAFITGATFGSEYADHTNDPRQSTLYNWWFRNSGRIVNVHQAIEELSIKIKVWEDKVSSFMDSNGKDNLNLSNAMNTLRDVQSSITKIEKQIENTEKALTSLRIPTSLKRFDNWFELFLKIQNCRWILIDITLPIMVGAAAVIFLVMLV